MVAENKDTTGSNENTSPQSVYIELPFTKIYEKIKESTQIEEESKSNSSQYFAENQSD
jgi:hypothetical protein